MTTRPETSGQMPDDAREHHQDRNGRHHPSTRRRRPLVLAVLRMLGMLGITAGALVWIGADMLEVSDGRVTFGDGHDVAEPAALIAFVDCLRGHGIDVPDPTPDGQLMLPDDASPNSTHLQDAGQDCAQHLDGSGIRIGGDDAGRVARP